MIFSILGTALGAISSMLIWAQAQSFGTTLIGGHQNMSGSRADVFIHFIICAGISLLFWLSSFILMNTYRQIGTRFFYLNNRTVSPQTSSLAIPSNQCNKGFWLTAFEDTSIGFLLGILGILAFVSGVLLSKVLFHYFVRYAGIRLSDVIALFFGILVPVAGGICTSLVHYWVAEKLFYRRGSLIL